MEGTEMNKCCICGREFEGWGNNPWPLETDGECCDECNMEYVIPARLIMRQTEQRPTKEDVEKWLKGE